MPRMNWFYGTLAVFEKDLRIELRSRYAINLLLMFVLSSLLLVLFGIGQEPVSPRVQSALLWIVVLFSAAVGLGRAFISEEERGTVLLLQLNTRPSTVLAGKLLFNLMLTLVMNLVALAAFLLLLGVKVRLPGLLVVTLLLGAIGLSGCATFLGAVIARTAGRGPLLPVLLFPILIPLLLSVVSATRTAMIGMGGWNVASDELLTLIGFDGTVLTAATLLFDYVWKE